MNFKTYVSTAILLSFLSCHNASKEQPPWKNLSWINQVKTSITITNTLDSTQAVRIYYGNKNTYELLDQTIELKSGATETVSINHFRPELISIRHTNGSNTFYLLPTKHLEIKISDTIRITGRNKLLYDPIIAIGDNQLDSAELDSLLSGYDSPLWLSRFFYRSKELQLLYTTYHQANYQYGYLGNELPQISKADSTISANYIKNTQVGRFHDYYTLLYTFQNFYYYKLDNLDTPNINDPYITNRNLADALLKIKDEEVRNEMLSIYTEGHLIRKQQSYTGKDEIYNDIISHLPNEYVLKLIQIGKTYDTSVYNEQDIVELLQKELTSSVGQQIPLSVNTTGYKLLKFWFVGCAPCKKQIPYENELLEEYEDLSVLHFCKNTRFDTWQDYIQTNKSKGDHYYIDSENLGDYKSTFSLSYSPRYILLDTDNKVVCWNCPNPSDTELQSILSSALQ